MSTFFLTSGRSGSTLVARLLHTHPDVAVVSDLFEPAVDEPYFDRHTQLTGPEFWQLLTRPSVAERIAYWREQPTDELLFLPEADDDVSLLMSYTLPFLSEDPWALRRRFELPVRTAERSAAPAHLEEFFELVRDYCDAKVWVERTGGSLPHTAKMLAAWPNARFVFLIRDPVETALSMRTGSFFRLYLAMEQGQASSWTDERFADPLALAAMLERWTVAAAQATQALPSSQLLSLTYEQLGTDPERVLLRLLSFVRPGPVTPSDHRWAAGQSALISPPALKAAELSQRELDALRSATAGSRSIWQQVSAAV